MLFGGTTPQFCEEPVFCCGCVFCHLLVNVRAEKQSTYTLPVLVLPHGGCKSQARNTTYRHCKDENKDKPLKGIKPTCFTCHLRDITTGNVLKPCKWVLGRKHSLTGKLFSTKLRSLRANVQSMDFLPAKEVQQSRSFTPVTSD